MNQLITNITKAIFSENKDNNFVFSPASYLEAMHNLCLCIKDNNLKEILDKLEISEENLFNYIKNYKQNLNLETYNVLLCSQEYWFILNSVVTNQIKELEVNIESLNCNDILSVVNKVNSIVVEKTHGKINNLISAEDITKFTTFIILSCVYFKKDWLYEFYEKHYKESFYGTKEQKQINFLNKQEYYNFYEDEILDIVELPYKDSDICCYLFVPTKNKTILDLIDNLQKNYNKINLVKNNCYVNLTCPQFKIESTFSLKKFTESIGINKIFELNKDWKLINFDQLLPEAVLKVENIIQKAYINFTKKDTEAAAATTILIGITGCSLFSTPPKIKYIHANKPFMYVLANSKNKNNPLFIGVLNQV